MPSGNHEDKSTAKVIERYAYVIINNDFVEAIVDTDSEEIVQSKLDELRNKQYERIKSFRNTLYNYSKEEHNNIYFWQARRVRIY